MTKNYMINFSYDDMDYYANVHENTLAPASFHIHIVAPFHTELPRKISLSQLKGRIITDTEIPDSLFAALCKAIKLVC